MNHWVFLTEHYKTRKEERLAESGLRKSMALVSEDKGFD